MIRPLITRVGTKPLQGFFRSSFHRATPFTSSLLIAPVAKRFATHQATRVGVPLRPQTATNWPKVLGQIGIIGGTIVGINLFFNRETREGGIPPVEQAYLHDTFKYVGAGLGLTALMARGLHASGWSYRFMAMNPWVALLGGLALSIGSMIGTFNTDPANSFQKHAFWGAFQLSQGLFLAPLYFFGPGVLGRAALYTVGTVGALSYVSATAKTNQYLYLGGPLLAGLTVVVLSSFAPMVLPITAVRTLAVTDMISIYGGLAIFGGFVLYDTQKIMEHARRGVRDPVAESISLELDFINIFIRLVGLQNRRK